MTTEIAVTVVSEPARVAVDAAAAELVVVAPGGANAELAAVAATLVRFRDLDGNPIEGKVVTVTVDTATDQVDDIIVEDA